MCARRETPAPVPAHPDIAVRWAALNRRLAGRLAPSLRIHARCCRPRSRPNSDYACVCVFEWTAAGSCGAQQNMGMRVGGRCIRRAGSRAPGTGTWPGVGFQLNFTACAQAANRRWCRPGDEAAAAAALQPSPRFSGAAPRCAECAKTFSCKQHKYEQAQPSQSCFA